jgi:hypothetical protein
LPSGTNREYVQGQKGGDYMEIEVFEETSRQFSIGFTSAK